MATRTTYKRLDVLTPDPTAAGADLLQDDLKLIDDVIAGIPDGGTAGQILAKATAANYDTAWIDAPSGGSSVTVDSTLSTTSTNPVQNALVTTAINGKANVATTLTGYGIADAYTKTEIDAKVASVYRFKGNVAAYANLPTSGQVTGDVYNVNDTGANYAWTGTEWDKLSETIDLTNYATTSALTTGLAGKAASSHTHEAGNITSGTLAIARIPTGTTASTVALGNHTHAYSAITGTPTLATVAETGSYNDLTDQPTIPTAYTLPTATSSVLGGVKVGTNLSIFDGTLSATNTTYNAATTTTAGLMSAADKTKLDGITASADAVSFSQTLTTGTAIGTITINGTGTTLYAPTGSGGSGGSNVTECNDSFSYYDGMCSAWHTSGCSPYPAELAHKAGFAYYASTANEANYAGTASYANAAGNADTAMTAYNVSGNVASAYSASSADIARYASWAGPCYGIYTNNTGVTSYSTSSKAVQYESNADEGDSTYVTICPLPPLGPFIVNLMVAYASETMTGSVNYLVCGSNLQITNISVLGGDNAAGNGLTLTSYFNISSAKLRLTKTFSNGCYTITAGDITTTATLCGRLVNNIYCSGSCCSGSSS